MVHGANALLQRLGETENGQGAPVDAPGLRNRIAGAPLEAQDPLIRRLAADHLRELRDDGVTLEYIARMYGVSAERMKVLHGELISSPPR